MKLLDAMLDGLRRIGCIPICKACLRAVDDVRSHGRFGDFSICARCTRSVTSEDEAFWVLP